MPAGDSTRAGCVLGYLVFELTPEPGWVESRIREFEWGQLSGSLEDRLFSPLFVSRVVVLCVWTRERQTHSSFSPGVPCRNQAEVAR